MTGKVLGSDLRPNGNSPRMSSLHDLVKNRPFIPRYEVQTSFFLSKDNHSSQNTNGGAERDRTADPLLAKQVLSQLSYSPNPFSPKAANLDQQTQPQTTSNPSRHRRQDQTWWARVDSN